MVKLRPHHGLCIHHFVGKGYSPNFVTQMTEVVKRLRSHPEETILLWDGGDVLCEACPHQEGGGCKSGPKPVEFDARCLDLCSLSFGEEIPWAPFSQQVKEKILIPGKLFQVCAGCQWLDLCLEYEKNNPF